MAIHRHRFGVAGTEPGLQAVWTEYFPGAEMRTQQEHNTATIGGENFRAREVRSIYPRPIVQIMRVMNAIKYLFLTDSLLLMALIPINTHDIPYCPKLALGTLVSAGSPAFENRKAGSSRDVVHFDIRKQGRQKRPGICTCRLSVRTGK